MVGVHDVERVPVDATDDDPGVEAGTGRPLFLLDHITLDQRVDVRDPCAASVEQGLEVALPARCVRLLHPAAHVVDDHVDERAALATGFSDLGQSVVRDVGVVVGANGCCRRCRHHCGDCRDAEQHQERGQDGREASTASDRHGSRHAVSHLFLCVST
ncbi:MAG TPA: hypothetical protein VFT16_00780 [Candidatus Saccharimonadales bacterium]|nr:hypothetical protein [Candidatus Saccharimonadales bacterium]